MKNNALCKIAVIETIRIKMFDQTVRIFSEIRHGPNFKKNLISLSTLDWKRNKYTTKDRVLKVNKDTRVVMKGANKV